MIALLTVPCWCLPSTATLQYLRLVVMAGQEVQTQVRGSNLSTLARQEAPSYPPQQNMRPSSVLTPRHDRFVPIGVMLFH